MAEAVTRRRLWVVAESAAWVVGLACLAGSIGFYVDGTIARRRQMERFAELKSTALRQPGPPDLSLWSPARIAAWHASSSVPGPTPLAILRIPRIRLEVPVIEGTDDMSLNRAVGHIEDTAIPGTDGNTGIAGHRDGFFRGLKDIAAGDAIELETLRASEMYRVERIWVVGPEEVSVLDPTPTRSVTLVTCYPFYFVGSAPQRYIVRAVLAGDTSTRTAGAEPPASRPE